MPNSTFVFEPEAGIAYPVNMIVNTSTDFEFTYQILNSNRTPFNFLGWRGSAQMAKSVAIGATLGAVATFDVSFSDPQNGELTIRLNRNQTSSLKEGRYVYDILVDSGETNLHRIVTGDILVYAGISSVP